MYIVFSENDRGSCLFWESRKKYNLSVSLYTPYADSLELAVFKSDNEIVSHNLIRKLAMIELSLEGFNRDMNWEGHKLSEYPVVIYGFDSKPKFYEFMVLDAESKEVGTVRTHSRKKTGGVLNQVSKNVNDYKGLATKSGVGSKLFADYGGNLYGGFVSKYGESPEMVIDLKNLNM